MIIIYNPSKCSNDIISLAWYLTLQGVFLTDDRIKQENHIHKLSPDNKFSTSIEAAHYGDGQRMEKGSKYHFLVRRGHDNYYYVYQRFGDRGRSSCIIFAL